jgi:hypothetical protein
MNRILVLLIASLISANSFAQTTPKKPVAQPTRPFEPIAPSADQIALLPNLRSDLEVIQRNISASELEDQKYTGGLIKAQIQSRIASLRITEAILIQKMKAIETGARMIIEVPSTRPDSSLAASLDAEAATQKLKIEQSRADADRYTGGLIKAQKESTIATMESTLAMLEQRALIAKYGLSMAPVGVASNSSTITPAPPLPRAQSQQEPASKIRAQEELVKVRLINKTFTTQEYRDFIFFDIEFVADKLKKPTRAIKGTLNLNDLFGERRMAIGWTVDRQLNPSESLVETGKGFKYNKFTDSHQWVKTTDVSNMTVTFTVECVLYQDGTREDF